jgi:hypothetical protein
MNIILSLSQFHHNHLFFGNSTENIILENSLFKRIIYANSDITLNGIYLSIPFQNIQLIWDEQHKKYFFLFHKKENQKIIDKMIEIEKQILEKTSIPFKYPKYKLFELLNMEMIKLHAIFTNPSNQSHSDYSLLLKISGIWENTTNYGITFKFFKYKN